MCSFAAIDGVCVCACLGVFCGWSVRVVWACGVSGRGWCGRSSVREVCLGGGRGCETEKTRISPPPTDCGPALSRLTSLFTPRARHSQPAHAPPPGAACLRNTHTHTHTPLCSPNPHPRKNEKQPPPRAPPEQPTKNKMCAALPTAHASGPALAARPARPSVRAAATPSPPPRDTSSSAAPPTKSGYPDMETSAADTGLLPRREPGSFPSPTLVAAWNRLSVELLEGADTGAPPAAAGEEAAYDPLRDGPARYLGYSNECGYVFFRTAAKTEERVGVGWPGWPPLRVCPGGCACARACGGGGRCVAVRGWPRPWPEGGRGFGREARRSVDERGDKKRPPAHAAAGPRGRLLVACTRLRPAPLCLDAGQASMWLPSALLDRRPARRAPRLECHPKNTRAWALDPAPRRRPTPQKRAAVGAPHPLPPLSPPSKTARPLPPGCPPLASPSPTPSPSATSSSTRWTRA